MGRVGLTREVRARLGIHLGLLLIALGVGYQLGPGWGVAVYGAGLCAMFVWLYDVDEPPAPPEPEFRRRGEAR